MIGTSPVTDEIVSQVQPLIPALRRHARAMLRGREDTDDLVQDALERAIAGWSWRRADGSVRAWLFAIVHNLALDRLRRTARRGIGEALEKVPEEKLATPPRQETVVETRDVMNLLSALPEDQRSVLLLVAVEDLSYAEVAAILDVPQGTVMSRLSRARERLRRMMEEGTRMDAPELRIVR